MIVCKQITTKPEYKKRKQQQYQNNKKDKKQWTL